MDDNEIPLAGLDEDEKHDDYEGGQQSGKIQIGKDGLPINVINDDESVQQTYQDKKKKLSSIEDDEELEEKYDDGEKKSTADAAGGHLDEAEGDDTLANRTRRFATIMNMLNSMLGAGILSVPNTFVNTGIVASIILSLLMALIAFGCTILVVILSHDTNTKGLGDLTFHVLKKQGCLVLTILNLIFLITALVAYLILAGDMITSWFLFGGIDLEPRYKHALMEFIYAVCIPIVLTIPRDISFLKYFSMATVFSIIFFTVSLLYKSIDFCIKNHGMEATCRVWKVDFSLFSSLSIYGLSYALPAVVMPAIKSYNPDLQKRKKVTIIAIIICFTLITIPGITGYLIFGEKTDGNILKSFDPNDILMIVCRAAFFIIVSCAYPMVSLSVMAMWGQLIFGIDQPSDLLGWRRAIVIVLNNVIPLILAMFLPTAKPILSIGGALGGCLVDFVFPSLMYIVLRKSEIGIFHWRNIICMICIVFGLVTAVIATYQAVVDAINSLK